VRDREGGEFGGEDGEGACCDGVCCQSLALLLLGGFAGGRKDMWMAEEWIDSLPKVLSTRMIPSAMTCRDVLYTASVAPDPHAGRSYSSCPWPCRRASSAFSRAVESCESIVVDSVCDQLAGSTCTFISMWCCIHASVDGKKDHEPS